MCILHIRPRSTNLDISYAIIRLSYMTDCVQGVNYVLRLLVCLSPYNLLPLATAIGPQDLDVRTDGIPNYFGTGEQPPECDTHAGASVQRFGSYDIVGSSRDAMSPFVP